MKTYFRRQQSANLLSTLKGADILSTSKQLFTIIDYFKACRFRFEYSLDEINLPSTPTLPYLMKPIEVFTNCANSWFYWRSINASTTSISSFAQLNTCPECASDINHKCQYLLWNSKRNELYGKLSCHFWRLDSNHIFGFLSGLG